MSLSDGKLGSRGQRLSHHCPSALIPFPACESYWASSEWGLGGRWLCPGGEGDGDEEQRSKFLPPTSPSLMSIISVITPVCKLALLSSYGDYVNEMMCVIHVEFIKSSTLTLCKHSFHWISLEYLTQQPLWLHSRSLQRIPHILYLTLVSCGSAASKISQSANTPMMNITVEKRSQATQIICSVKHHAERERDSVQRKIQRGLMSVINGETMRTK